MKPRIKITKKNNPTKRIAQLISAYGSQSGLANELGVKQSTVSLWSKRQHGMPALEALIAQEITDGEFQAIDLCPDLALAKGVEI